MKYYMQPNFELFKLPFMKWDFKLLDVIRISIVDVIFKFVINIFRDHTMLYMCSVVF